MGAFASKPCSSQRVMSPRGMGDTPSSSKWIPEDDLILKNAVEAGASLESLAKGAVCFSRHFDIQELQNRWFSLLYDSDTSAEASARIIKFEVELIVSNPGKVKRSCELRGKEFPLGKRKEDSIHSQYYEMRKRICCDPRAVTGIDTAVLSNSQADRATCCSCRDNAHHITCQCNGQYSYGKLVLDDFAACGSNQTFYTGITGTMENELSHGKAGGNSSYDHAANKIHVPVEGLVCNNERFFNPNHSYLHNIEGEDQMLPTKGSMVCNVSTSDHMLNDLKKQTIKLEGSSTDFPCATNITKDEVLFFNDLGGTDFGELSCIIDLSDYLLNTPSETYQDVVPDITRIGEEDTLQNCAVPDVGASEELLCDLANSSSRNENRVSCSVGHSASSSRTSDLAECEVLMTCVLNTEDPDVPCNDDIILHYELHATEDLQGGIGQNNYLASSEIVTYDNVKYAAKDSFMMMEEHVANVDQGLSLNDFTVKVELHGGNSDLGSSKLADDELDICIPATSSLHSASDDEVKEGTRTSGSCLAIKFGSHVPLNATLSYREIPSSNQVSDMSTSDQDQISDTENDIPHFSDVEAMILGMSLSPIVQEEWYYNKGVSRWSLHTKKAIVRLEQAAQSSMSRAISSHGAFAVFYGHNLRYFIRLPQILIGRATEDVKVDIDLRLEGPAKKISRRQAVIKMDEDGSFMLINIGCNSVVVDRKDVRPRKCTKLKSDSLIEISSMAFIFKVNDRAVKQRRNMTKYL